MKDGEIFLDLGTCFGQDLRQLVMDGAPSAHTYGIDIEGALIDLGYNLFRDRQSLKTTFIIGDVFDPKMNWSQLGQNVDIFHASAVFHLFSWGQQVELACLLVRLGRPRPGTLIIGRQVGYIKPGVYPSRNNNKPAYRHNVETLQQMWQEVGAKTGTAWAVEASMDMVGFTDYSRSQVFPEEMADADNGIRRLLFSIRRL